MVEPKVQSVNVSHGLRDVHFASQTVTTGFFKNPVSGPVQAHKLGLTDDAQGDLTVHGGLEKAVYFYPREHYTGWERLLGSGPLEPGSFGENVTCEGLVEAEVYVGDILQIGGATLQVVQPRSPCYKLQIRFGRSDMTALFFRQGKPGWYASVLEEGAFSAGDNIALLERGREKVSIADVWRWSAQAEVDQDAVARVSQLSLLPAFWRRRVAR